MDTVDGYILYDTERGAEPGLQVFSRKCDVGNHYNAIRQWVLRIPGAPTWTKQTRFIAKPIRIIDAETGETFS